jgi:hypothetical protein
VAETPGGERETHRLWRSATRRWGSEEVWCEVPGNWRLSEVMLSGGEVHTADKTQRSEEAGTPTTWWANICIYFVEEFKDHSPALKICIDPELRRDSLADQQHFSTSRQFSPSRVPRPSRRNVPSGGPCPPSQSLPPPPGII